MKWKTFAAIVIEIAYLLFFHAGNFSIIFPGEPMAWSFKVGMALISIINFGIMLVLARKKILTKKPNVILFVFVIAISLIYLTAGVNDFIRFMSDGNMQRSEHLIAFLICIEEILLRMICLFIV